MSTKLTSRFQTIVTIIVFLRRGLAVWAYTHEGSSHEARRGGYWGPLELELQAVVAWVRGLNSGPL